jgi:ribonuclease HI
LALSTVSAALPHQPPKPPDKFWAKPPVGPVKLSTDGSFGTKEGRPGCAMVLRDDQLNIIFSACRFLPRCVEAGEAELLACREGLELALQNSNLPIIIESNCV